jgi:hypothetical protein
MHRTISPLPCHPLVIEALSPLGAAVSQATTYETAALDPDRRRATWVSGLDQRFMGRFKQDRCTL